MARVAGQRRPGHRTAPADAAPRTGTAPVPAVDDAQGAGAAPVGEPDLLVVGRIGKPQGIKGEVTVQVRTDDPDARFAQGSELLTDPPERGPLTVAGSRWQNGRLVVAFAGVADRNDAERLRETLLQVDGRTLPPPEDEDEFHDHVLRGMTAVLVDGSPLGEVVDVLHLPHGDVLVVRRPAPSDGGTAAPEVLVPFVKAMVPVVDVAARRLEVDPPEGLLDLTAADPDAGAPTDEGLDADLDGTAQPDEVADPDGAARPGAG